MNKTLRVKPKTMDRLRAIKHALETNLHRSVNWDEVVEFVLDLADRQRAILRDPH